MAYVPYYFLPTGACIGVVDQDDGAIIPKPTPGEPLHPRWQKFLVWDEEQPLPLDLNDLLLVVPKKRRSLLAIRADLVALSGAQKTAVWADITSGSPPKWSLDDGINAGAIAVLTLLGASGTLSAADVLEAKLRGVAMYCQDKPNYLVSPAFDPTISIPGDEPA